MNRGRRPKAKALGLSSSRPHRQIPFWFCLAVIFVLIYDIGFEQSDTDEHILDALYLVTLIMGIGSTVVRYLFFNERPHRNVMAWDGLSMCFLAILVLSNANIFRAVGLFEFFNHAAWVNTGLFLVLFREFSALQIHYKRSFLNPAQLFILSFLGIIFMGCLLLMLPKATHEGITLIDALFTSTSAVCVTGLIVVDTATHFTRLGQSIILLLIQIGGLGIMTFASYFSYFFRGGSSYDSQVMVGSFTNAQRMGEVFSVLKVILLTTLLIEGVGSIMIYFTLNEEEMPLWSDQVFFAVFHSVSGFCNAGFSTLSEGLYQEGFRFNYSLQMIIAALFIIGGLGFPIVYNLVRFFRQTVQARYYAIVHGRKMIFTPWLLNMSTRIVLITSLILTIAGFVLFFLFEYDNTLAEHSFTGKLATAFFGATTPRTAGFNTVDMTLLSFPTIMFIFLLMWIGASPGSTGGGIKTSTFAIATLNFISLARGKNRIEIFRREIADISVRRASAIISLSLVVIGGGTFCIAYVDGDHDLLHIAFECFSAYSTVGLSLGLTPELSHAGKMVIIGIMFVGRVSMLTILIAVFRKVKTKAYSYPSEEVLIN